MRERSVQVKMESYDKVQQRHLRFDPIAAAFMVLKMVRIGRLA